MILTGKSCNAPALCDCIDRVDVAAFCLCNTTRRKEQQRQSFSMTSSAWEVLRDNLPSSEDISWFDVQAVGPDALRWRLALIDTATTSIDAQYFIWEEDAVGSLLLGRLLQAADRGVRVRMLIDDSFLAGEDQLALAADAHPNLELRIFNPFEIRSENMLVRYVENLNDLPANQSPYA